MTTLYDSQRSSRAAWLRYFRERWKSVPGEAAARLDHVRVMQLTRRQTRDLIPEVHESDFPPADDPVEEEAPSIEEPKQEPTTAALRSSALRVDLPEEL